MHFLKHPSFSWRLHVTAAARELGDLTKQPQGAGEPQAMLSSLPAAAAWGEWGPLFGTWLLLRVQGVAVKERL